MIFTAKVFLLWEFQVDRDFSFNFSPQRLDEGEIKKQSAKCGVERREQESEGVREGGR